MLNIFHFRLFSLIFHVVLVLGQAGTHPRCPRPRPSWYSSDV